MGKQRSKQIGYTIVAIIGTEITVLSVVFSLPLFIIGVIIVVAITAWKQLVGALVTLISEKTASFTVWQEHRSCWGRKGKR